MSAGGGVRGRARALVLPALAIGAPTVVALGVGPGAAAAQDETVGAVRMSVVITGSDAQVILEVDVEGASQTGTLPATILDFGPATPVDLALGSDGEPGSLELDRGVARVGEVRVEPGAVEGTRLVLATYRVRDAVVARGASLRGHVPVLSVDRRPTVAGPGFFRAELRLPPEWSLTEGFPSAIRATDRPGVYEVDLSVIPSVISFRGRADGAWRPGVPLILDLVAGVVLLGFSVVGWRHLRAVAA